MIRSLLLLVLAVAGCAGTQPSRVHTPYFAVRSANVIPYDDGSFQYVIDLRAVKTVPGTSILRFHFARPGQPDYLHEWTVPGGKRRFQHTTAVFKNYSSDASLGFRLTLVAPDRHTVLDRLQQRIQ